MRQFLLERGTEPVIPNNPTRKRFHPFDAEAYKQRNLIERMFCRLKDWRRIATRYDKLVAFEERIQHVWDELGNGLKAEAGLGHPANKSVDRARSAPPH